MADVPDERARPDAWTGASFPPLRAGAHPLRDRAVREGGGPPICRPRWPARHVGVPRWRLLDRRYRELSLDRPPRMAGHRARRFPECPAVVHLNREPPGRAARHASAEAVGIQRDPAGTITSVSYRYGALAVPGTHVRPRLRGGAGYAGWR